MKTDTGIALVYLDEEGVDRAFRADVLKGLNQLPKAIPARWFYDQEGSRLFERITQLDEYYPTRAETDILKTRSNEFAQLVGQGRAVVEFGSGSSVKTPLLLEAIDPVGHAVTREDGDSIGYGTLIWATGGAPPQLPLLRSSGSGARLHRRRRIFEPSPALINPATGAGGLVSRMCRCLILQQSSLTAHG